MAKISVTFKGLPLHSVELAGEQVHIGRDPSNDVHIDSLAVGEFHAVMTRTSEGYRIRPLQDRYPVAVNQTPVSDALLRNGDEIQVGKHTLVFLDDQPRRRSAPAAEQERQPAPLSPQRNASLQVLTGKWSGVVIPLKTAVTRIGREKTGTVEIARDERGCSIAVASGDLLVTVNGKVVSKGENARLADRDLIKINTSLFQYFEA